MDPLSEMLALLKPKSYITAGFDAGGSWALILDDLAGRIKCYAVVKGGCWLSMEESDGPVFLKAGDCFVLPTGRPALIASDLEAEPELSSQTLDPDRSGEVVTFNGGGDVFLVGSRFEMNGRHAEVMLQALPPFIHVESTQDRTKLRLYIELMMEELRDARPGAFQVAQNLSHMMLAQALRLFIESSPGGVGWFTALADPKLAQSIKAMHSDPSHAWTLEELARKAGMSRTSFAQYFRRRVGETPISYLARWRMMSAGTKLIQGEETMAEISMSLGYSSEHAFSTAFKRIMGQSPRRYGRSQKQNVNSNQ
ncbi:AraC family transcriptional regulator [Rhizobium leguminosarum]|uniref:AraC family transcriptional regulator n=1 Tax=Rhizobium leguminosarum TaxID=384 RepID=UPI003F9893BA